MLIFGGGKTFYDIFCTENILNLSLYQTITSLTKGNLHFLVGKNSNNGIKHFYFKLKLTRSNFFVKPKNREGLKYTKYYVTICPIILYENNTVK